jgi:hypothetical protein
MDGHSYVKSMIEQYKSKGPFANILQSPILRWAFALYLALHVLYFVLPSLSFVSDSRSYYQWAEENINGGTLYPSHSNVRLQEEGVVAPVYINMEVAVLSVWNTPKAIFTLNALLNIGQLILICLLTRTMFGQSAAVVAGCLYVGYLNNLGLVLMNYTEFAFGFFILLSAYLFFTRRGILALLASGFILGLAIGVRPTAMAAGFAYVVAAAWDALQKRWELRRPLLVMIGFCVYVLAAGLYTRYSINDFVFMSTTGPANIILGANDQADGQYNEQVLTAPEFKRDTYKERNQAYLHHAIDWITAHPFRWIATFPRRLYSTFITDDFAVSQLLLDQEWTFNRFVKDFRKGEAGSEFGQEPLWFKVAFLTLNSYHQLFYLAILIAFILRVVALMKAKSVSREEVLLYLFISFGIAMTVVGSIGSLRYKYNYFIIAIILCSPYVTNQLQRRFGWTI